MASLGLAAEQPRLLDRATLLGIPAGELALRVANGQKAGAVFPIDVQKCTLGADDGCTLRLDHAGVRPLHCLILRGEAETVIRRWSPDTRLNGRDFTDAPLRAGDRLSLGPLDLEVVTPEAIASGSDKTHAPAVLDQQRSLDEALQQLADERAAWDDQRRQWQAEQAAHMSRGAQESDELDKRLVELEAQGRLLDEQRQAWERQFRDEQRQLDESRRAWYEERRASELQLSQQIESLREREERLAVQRAELDRQAELARRATDGIDQDRQDASADVERREAALVERERSLQADRDKLDRERTALQAEQTAFHAERDGWEEVQEEARTRLSDKMQQLERRLSELNAERAAWESQRDRSLAEFEEQSQTLSRKLANLEGDRRTLLSERAAWQTEQHQRETQWTGRQRTLAAAEEELARQKTEAELRQQQLASREARLREAEENGAAVEARLTAERNDLSKLRKALDDERAAWESDRERVAQADRESLTSAEAEAGRLRAELAAQGEQLGQVRTAHAEADRCRVAAEEKLARQQAALEAARRALEEERAAWQSKQSEPSTAVDAEATRLAEEELARLHQDLESQRSALAEIQRQQAAAADDIARQQAELEAARLAIDDERARWQSEQAELKNAAIADQANVVQQAAADRERLATLEAELESLRRAWDEERETWQADAQRRATQPIAAPAAEADGDLQRQLLELSSELEAARRALDDDRRHWEAERQRQAAELAKHATQLQELRRRAPADHEPTADTLTSTPDETPINTDEQRAEMRECPVEATDLLTQFAGQEAAEVSFAEPTDAAPVDMADLLSRFGVSIDSSTESVDSHGSDQTPLPDETSAGRAARPAPHAEEEEDSIDEYMARLMQRLGAKAQTPPPRQQQPAPTMTPVVLPEIEPETAPVAPVATKLTDPSEMGRRALPPERAADLSAMRELANLNARSAIDKHQRRTIRHTGVTKAAVSLVGVVGAVVEGVFWLQGSPTAFYLMLGSVVVALFWGWQYATMWRKLAVAPSESATRPAGERRVAERRAPQPTETIEAAEAAAEPDCEVAVEDSQASFPG